MNCFVECGVVGTEYRGQTYHPLATKLGQVSFELFFGF